jgi:hypothetical protein
LCRAINKLILRPIATKISEFLHLLERLKIVVFLGLIALKFHGGFLLAFNNFACTNELLKNLKLLFRREI